MSQENGHEAKPNSAREDQYQLRGSGSATDLMAKRTISEHAAFLMPYLRPGMRLVDCGCGPGTMTIGFAEFLKPAEVVGLDISGDQIAVAEQLAAYQGVSNVR